MRELDAARGKLQSTVEARQAERNAASKAIGVAKSKGEDAAALLASVASLSGQLKAEQAELAAVKIQLHDLLADIPNSAA